MERSRVALATALSGLLLFAASNQSSKPINLTNSTPVTDRSPVCEVVRLHQAGAADGSAIANPFSWSGWTVASAEACSGGRLFVSTQTAQEYELVILFTTAGASCNYQLFGFSTVHRDKVPSANRGSLVFPAGDNNALQFAYPIAQDDGSRTFTATATDDTVKLGTSGCTLYPDETSGTTYYVGAAQRHDIRGWYAIMDYVTSISAGEVLFALRPI